MISPQVATFDIHTEGGKAGIRMVLRVGMHGNVALIEVCNDGIRLKGRLHVLLRDEKGYGCALRVVILLGNVQHMRTDHLGHPLENAGQSFGVVLLVDIFDVVTLFALGLCVADIINVEGQRLGQVVEPVSLSLFCISYPHNTKKSPGERGTHGTLSLEMIILLFADASAHSVGFMEEERVYIARIVTLLLLLIVSQV